MLVKVKHPRNKKEYDVEKSTISKFEHPLPNGEGEDVSTKCVKFTIVGNGGTWEDWALLKDFKKLNPNIKY